MKKKRLGVFVVYDPEGVLDRYVFYLLDKLTPLFDKLVIVCNGEIQNEFLMKLYFYTSDVYVRKNEGYDAIAYKNVLEDYLGWKVVCEYDELIMFNDTFFGPFYSFDEVFNKMDAARLDFWGITKHEHVKYSGGTEYPAHIQSFFLAVEKKLLCSQDLQDFFLNMKRDINGFNQAVLEFEIRFSQTFDQLGYKWGALVDSTTYGSTSAAYNYNQYMWVSNHLIREKGCPILKKKIFEFKDFNTNAREDAKRCLEYIQSNTEYDVDMIWEHILRRYNIADVQKVLHLIYCLSDYEGRSKKISDKKCIVIIFSKEMNQLTAYEYAKYLNDLSEEVDVLVVVGGEEEKKIWQCNITRKVKYAFLSGGSPLTFLLGEGNAYMKPYEYVGFVPVRLFDGVSDKFPNQEMYMRAELENVVKSNWLINNILEVFENNNRLGILAPPQVMDGNGSYTGRSKWKQYYEEIRKIAIEYKVDRLLNHDKYSFVEPRAFWARVEALQKCNDIVSMGGMTKNEYVLEKMIVYLMQNAGYCSGMALSSSYASVELNTLMTRII